MIFFVDLSNCGLVFPIDIHFQHLLRFELTPSSFSSFPFSTGFSTGIYQPVSEFWTVRFRSISIKLYFWIPPLVVYYGKMSKHEIIRARIPIFETGFEHVNFSESKFWSTGTYFFGGKLSFEQLKWRIRIEERWTGQIEIKYYLNKPGRIAVRCDRL